MQKLKRFEAALDSYDRALALRPNDAAALSNRGNVFQRDALQIAHRRRSDILHFGDDLRDFADTAALKTNLDLMISVDTAIAHLAGALAMPTWVLLPFGPDWRWLLGRDDSPWYPASRLFRQDESRTWQGVVARVTDALRERLR